jgi:outer membrane protein assembly factor BamB
MFKVHCVWTGVLIVLGSILILALSIGRADQKDQSTLAFTLPFDSKSKDAIERAGDFIKQEAWEDALKVLQSVLDAPEDSFVPVKHDAGDSKHDVYVSARVRANRLIESMPPKAKEIYEQRFGSEASRLFEDAKKNKVNQANFAAIAKRYPHTLAGREALKAIVKPSAASLQPKETVASWPVFGGDATRSSQVKGGLLLMETKWTQPMHVGTDKALKQAEQWAHEAIKSHEDRHIPILPAFFPIGATIKNDGKVVPLVIYRSFYGIHAVNAKTGKLHWETPSMLSIDYIVRNPGRRSIIGSWIATNSGGKSDPLFENSLLGCLSADNSNVYVVDDMAVVPNQDLMRQMQVNNPRVHFGHLDEFIRCNRLQAFELDSGKIQWELGGQGPDGGELGDSYFLGPPLPLDGYLYVLNEKNGDIRLVCLDSSKNWNQGKDPIVWKLRLGTVRETLLVDTSRRIRAANISYAEGILVCPTNAGMVLGVDLLTRSLAWAYSYRKDLAPKANDKPMPQMANPKAMMVARERSSEILSEFEVSAPVIQDGKVVFAGPDCPDLHCIKLNDGTRLWRVDRSEDLFLAGVFNAKVLLVGKNACRALAVSDGKELWKVETGLPSGRGMAVGKAYYLPLKAAAHSGKPAIYGIDIDRGLIASKTSPREKPEAQPEVPGNLLFFSDELISQSVDAIIAYPQPER